MPPAHRGDFRTMMSCSEVFSCVAAIQVASLPGAGGRKRHLSDVFLKARGPELRQPGTPASTNRIAVFEYFLNDDVF